MKKFMITAAMSAMFMTIATGYGNTVNVMAASSGKASATEKNTAKTTDSKSKEKETKATDDKEDEKETTKIEKGDSLIIKVDDLSEDATFYPIEVDGTEMEVIVVKDAEGTIRTAFNTCQICYDFLKESSDIFANWKRK